MERCSKIPKQMRKIYVLLYCVIVLTKLSSALSLVDSCFMSATPGTSFTSSANLSGQDSDLLQWTGSAWTGGWPGASLTIPPPINTAGCRAIFIGSGSSWTTGGEGFGLRFTPTLVAGQTYTFRFTYVSHGTGSTGSFAPFIYTNTSGSTAGAFALGSLPAVGYTWTSNTITFTATAAQAGHNWIILHSGSSGSSGMIASFCCTNNPCSVNLGPDLTLCPGQTVVLNATTTNATYLWQNNSTGPTFTVTAAGTYWVRITVGACVASDTVHVYFSTNPIVNLGNDTTLCPSQTLVLNATTPTCTYHWQNNATTPTLTVTTAGTYSVTVTNSNGCTGSDAINVNYATSPTPSITGPTSICAGTTATLNAGAGFSSYLWSTTATTQSISISNIGTYTVTVSNSNGCTGSASLTVSQTASPTPTITGPTAICAGTSSTLDAGAGYTTYLWSTTATTQTITVTTAGIYSVTVSNGGGGPAVFWAEAFQNACATGCLASGYVSPNGPWSITLTGANGADANTWFVSGQECGNAAGACGSVCGATDPSLHVGSTTVGNDPGAAYMAGGLGLWFPLTDKRADSPTINCTGKTNITVSFNYIENGQNTIDNATLWYFNGTLWAQLSDMPKTLLTCTPQGLWTAFSIALPASADNNPNVKLGFRWVNNDDNVGTDPSFAVDDITLSAASAASCIGSGQVTVTVNPNPTPSITGTLAICPGATTTLDAGAGYASYLWSTNATTQTIPVTIAGTYSVTVTNGNGCSGTASVNVTQSANPTPTINGPTTICANSSAVLNAGAGYASYLWSTTATTQSITITTGGTYSVTVTNAGGCSGTASLTVTQSTSLTPSITGQTTICPGTSTTLDAGAGYAGYLWSTNAMTQTITANTAGTYSVTVSNAGGCTGTASIVVVVTAMLPITVVAQPQTICPGNPVTLTASGGNTYQWNTAPPSTGVSIVVNPTVNTTYIVTATYNGCTGSSAVTVNVNSYLGVSTTSTDASCTNDDGTATASLSGAGYTYLWSTVPPQTAQTATGLAGGTYSVTVSYNGCTGTANATIISVAGPVAAFYTKPDFITINEGPVFFYDQSIGNITAWEWNFGDNNYASGNQVNHVYTDTGAFVITLVVIDANGCMDTAQETVIILPYFAFWIPNSFTPNNDEKNPVFKPIGVGLDTKNYLMTIYDRWGKEMFFTKNINEGWNGTYNNKGDFSKGVQGVYVYLIEVADRTGKKHIYKGTVTLIQ